VNTVNRDSVTAVAKEDTDGTTASWMLTVHAFCGVATSGYAIYESSDQTSFPSTWEVTECPGKVILGGGFYLSGDDGEVPVSAHKPLEYPAGVWYGQTSAAEIQAGTPDNWNLTDQVICAGA